MQIRRSQPIMTLTVCACTLLVYSCTSKQQAGPVDGVHPPKLHPEPVAIPEGAEAPAKEVAAKKPAGAPVADRRRAERKKYDAAAASPRRPLAKSVKSKGRWGAPHPAATVGGALAYRGQGYADPHHSTEQYDQITENGFLAAVGNPLSTFSIDVDTASYSNVRRFLRSGRKPYPDAVRIEELVNYFTYDYPDPKDDVPFSVTTELSSCPWNHKNHLLHVGLQAKRVSLEKLPPNNLVFLLDVSGSMNHPKKLPLLVSAFKLLVGEMREEDHAAIVVYAGAAGMVLPPTSGADKGKIVEALEKLRAGGSTAGGAGIKLAYKVAKENYDPKGNNRVILATDGDFNVGVSSDAELVRMIEEKRKDGIFLTVLGLGSGNYKGSKMEKLADKGNGNYAYLDSLTEARKVLVTEMGGTLLTIAKDVKVQIEFNPAKVKEYRLVGYENRMLKKEDFADDKKDAGELGAGHTVTALYEIVPETGEPSAAALRYQETRPKASAMGSDELAYVKLRYKPPKAERSILVSRPVSDKCVKLAKSSDNFQFSAAVATWGMLLRNSKHKGSASYEQVSELADAGKGHDEFGYRAEFLELVKLSAKLEKK